MAPKKKASKSPTLSQLRTKIDRLDSEILDRISQRASLAQQAGTLKQAKGLPAYDPTREQEMVAKLVELNKGPLDDVGIESLFRELISRSRALEQQHRVAFLGPRFSYSHLAAVRRFGQGVDFSPVATIAAVFEEVERRSADFGVVPIENSTDGRITDTLNLFTRVRVSVCGEVQLRIHHNLLGQGERSTIREVCSKPQALSQCRDWLARHLPDVPLVETPSTTAAAKRASENEGVAAVASEQAGQHYGLRVIDASIEDNVNNVTRFAIIGHEEPRRTGNDKTSLMFQVEHQPGTLADTMAIFKRNRLNLTWIESFPLAGVSNEYLFFVELEGHRNEAKIKRAITSLEKKTVMLEVLGSYARTKPVD